MVVHLRHWCDLLIVHGLLEDVVIVHDAHRAVPWSDSDLHMSTSTTPLHGCCLEYFFGDRPRMPLCHVLEAWRCGVDLARLLPACHLNLHLLHRGQLRIVKDRLSSLLSHGGCASVSHIRQHESVPSDVFIANNLTEVTILST